MKLYRKFIVVLTAALALCLTACGDFSELRDAVEEISRSEVQNVISADMPELSEEEGVEEAEIPGVSGDRYAYQVLEESTKRVYDQIYDAMQNHKEEVTVSTLDKEELKTAYQAVMADYGGIFWVSGYAYTEYTRGDELVRLLFAPKYTMTAAEREEMQTQIDAAVEEILFPIREETSDYEKAKYIYEYLTSNVEYQADAENNQNIISVFIGKATVCQGYSCAASYLLEQLGIQSVIVCGTANGGPHAWNLVKLDGDYYYMDTTWGNAAYSGSGISAGNYVNYNYFAVTTAELEKSHTADGVIPLPECTANQDNYYVREGKYFTEWEPDKIGNILQQAYQNGEETVSVKFADHSLCEQGIAYFITEQKIAEYCSDITNFYYLEDENQNVLIIKF